MFYENGAKIACTRLNIHILQKIKKLDQGRCFSEPKYYYFLFFFTVIKTISTYKTHNKHFSANRGVEYVTCNVILCRTVK